MAEWSMAAALKAVEPQGSVGSNPTPSATKIAPPLTVARQSKGPKGRPRRDDRVAEGARLLSECGV